MIVIRPAAIRSTQALKVCDDPSETSLHPKHMHKVLFRAHHVTCTVEPYPCHSQELAISLVLHVFCCHGVPAVSGTIDAAEESQFCIRQFCYMQNTS